MLARILRPPRGPDGGYGGMADDFQFGEPVECRWLDSKEKGILVKGSEFLRLGGSTDSFLYPDKEYVWGLYEIV